MDTVSLLSEISILKRYIEWLETSLASYEPDWICDKMGDKDLCHDWCYANCGTEAWTHDCFKKYYDNFVADRKTEPITHDDYIESENDYLEAMCLNCNNAKACKEKHWDGCVYEPKDEKTCETCRHWKYIAHEWQCEACKCQGYEPKDEPQTDVINPQEPTNDEKCFECDDFFTCGGQCNKIEDEPQTERSER